MATPIPEIIPIPLADLAVDDITLQCRIVLDQAVIDDYAEAYRAGNPLPPLLVYQLPDGRNLLVDGYHRRPAALAAGLTALPCEIRRGVTLADARWAATAANAAHGLRRSRADKGLAVQRALILRPDLSDRAIAQHTGTSHPFVAQIRREAQAAAELARPPSQPAAASEPAASPKRIGLDGRARSVPDGLDRHAADYPPMQPGQRECAKCHHPHTDHGPDGTGECRHVLGSGHPCFCCAFKPLPTAAQPASDSPSVPSIPSVPSLSNTGNRCQSDPPTHRLLDAQISPASVPPSPATGSPRGPSSSPIPLADGTLPNAHGVYLSGFESIDYQVPGGDAYIHVAQYQGGAWISVMGFGHRHGSCTGQYGPLSVDTSPTHSERRAAIAHAAERLIAAQTAIIDGTNSCTTDRQRRAAQAIRGWAKAILSGDLAVPAPRREAPSAASDPSSQPAPSPLRSAIQTAVLRALAHLENGTIESLDLCLPDTDDQLSLWGSAAAVRVSQYATRLADIASVLSVASCSMPGAKRKRSPSASPAASPATGSPRGPSVSSSLPPSSPRREAPSAASPAVP